MTEQILNREQVKAAVADMKAAMNEMELQALTKAISEERRKTGWGQHPLEIRLSIPFIKNRFYLVIVGGKDQRSKERIAEDRKTHPLVKFWNIPVFLFAGTVAVLAAIGVLSLVWG